mgnify:CR=1 FL=1
MHHDKILDKLKPGLYCVATPIGNLDDISKRAIHVLKNSEIILCEDTRVSKKLLNRFEINNKLFSYHKFNELKKLDEVIKVLENKKIVSLISDAGTPAVSDPGRILINECLKKNISVLPIPGPSAVTTAISISGFSDRYIFCGFLPEKKNQIENLFKELSNKNYSIVFFISPKKIIKIIDIIKEYFSGRNILICREISKFYEEYLRSSVDDLGTISIKEKGEITVVISELLEKQNKLKELKESDKKKIKSLIKKMTIKNIIKVIGAESNISKKEIYNYCLSIKNEDK